MAIAPEARLRDCAEEQIGVSIPIPLNARLDALVRRANGAGESTSRKELLAALVLAASDEALEIVEAIRLYRMAEARDAVASGEDESSYFAERDRRPGPRPRKAP